MLRAVLDTNVLISALEFGGFPERIYDAWKNNEFVKILPWDLLCLILRTKIR